MKKILIAISVILVLSILVEIFAYVELAKTQQGRYLLITCIVFSVFVLIFPLAALYFEIMGKSKKNKKGKTYLAKCGHETKEIDIVSAFGEKTETKVPIKNGEIEYCHKCLDKMAIRCAWCGRPIFVGDPITLYSPTDKNFKIPEYAVVYNKDPLQLVGCPRMDCAESGCDYAGRWVPPSTVYRHPSVIEMTIANPGCAVIGNNLNGKTEFEIIKIKPEE
ncbi:MAG: hypothetical protein WAV10_03100 [Minisyncoccia bacterium]